MNIVEKLKSGTKEGRLITTVVAVMLISVLGTVGGAIYNAASVNNLTEAVAAVSEVNDKISVGQERTSCRTAVQAGYDASFSRIILGLIADDEDVPEGLLSQDYSITPNVLVAFERSVIELDLLENGQICVGDNPTRAAPEPSDEPIEPEFPDPSTTDQ